MLKYKVSAVFISVFLVHCSSDPAPGPSSPSADAAADIAQEVTPDVSTTDTADTSGPQPVTCGSLTCNPTKVGPYSVSACCKESKCGLILPPSPGNTNCVITNQPGVQTTHCPTWNIGSATYKGCCKPTGVCGLYDPTDGSSPTSIGCFLHEDFGLPTPSGAKGACNPDGGALPQSDASSDGSSTDSSQDSSGSDAAVTDSSAG